MRLMRALSNPDTVAGLHRLGQLRGELLAEESQGAACAALRPRSGAIQDAVLQVLAESAGARRPVEIHAQVEIRLGHEVSPDTISSAPAVACRVRHPTVVRIGYGPYQIAR